MSYLPARLETGQRAGCLPLNSSLCSQSAGRCRCTGGCVPSAAAPLFLSDSVGRVRCAGGSAVGACLSSGGRRRGQRGAVLLGRPLTPAARAPSCSGGQGRARCFLSVRCVLIVSACGRSNHSVSARHVGRRCAAAAAGRGPGRGRRGGRAG